MSSQPLVSLTFDDGLRCQFERALPILDEYGLTATFFLVANTDPIHTDGCQHPDWSKINWSDQDIQLLKRAMQRGHEIGAHSMTHRRPELDNDPRFEAEGSRQWIEVRLGAPIPSYCYPFFYITDEIKRAVIDAKYKQARWGATRGYSAQQAPVDFYQVDSRLVARDSPQYVTVNGTQLEVGRDGAEDVKGWLQSGWYVLTFHGVGTIYDGWWPISVVEFTRQMAELARLRDRGKVEVVTFKEGADRSRQMMTSLPI